MHPRFSDRIDIRRPEETRNPGQRTGGWKCWQRVCVRCRICPPSRIAGLTPSATSGARRSWPDLFCTTDRCPAIVGTSLVYFGRMHATLEYTQLLAPVLGALTDRALAGG
jgi:hypothetical protein